MGKIFLIIFSVICFSISNIALAYDPPTGFSDDFHKDIAIALSKNGVKGCGYLVWKKNPKYKSGEYLVYCSRDGENWRPYTVWLPAFTAQEGHY